MKRALWIALPNAAVAAVAVTVWFAVFDGPNLDGGERTMRRLAEMRGDNRAMWEIKRDNAFIRAVRDRDVAAVRRFLRTGANVNARYLDGYAFFGDRGASDRAALLEASAAGHAELVQILLDAGADPEIARDGRTSLWMGANSGSDKVVQLLLEAGAKGDPRRMRLTMDLIRAACRGFRLHDGEGYPRYPGYWPNDADAPEIADVLKQGADVNGANPEGYTPLMFAANLGMVDHVRELLEAGADPSLQSNFGETALSLAEEPDAHVAVSGRREVARVLRERLPQDDAERQPRESQPR